MSICSPHSRPAVNVMIRSAARVSNSLKMADAPTVFASPKNVSLLPLARRLKRSCRHIRCGVARTRLQIRNCMERTVSHYQPTAAISSTHLSRANRSSPVSILHLRRVTSSNRSIHSRVRVPTLEQSVLMMSLTRPLCRRLTLASKLNCPSKGNTATLVSALVVRRPLSSPIIPCSPFHKATLPSRRARTCTKRRVHPFPHLPSTLRLLVRPCSRVVLVL